MKLSHRAVMVLSAQMQRQTNKTASEMLSSGLKFKSLQSLKLFNKSNTTIRQQFNYFFLRTLAAEMGSLGVSSASLLALPALNE